MKVVSDLKAYYLVSIFSVIFAVVGFSYNTWRLEVSEENNNIRTAAFTVIEALAEFEQILYAAHYDKNVVEGSPRKGWVKMGVIVDLSMLISESTLLSAQELHLNWSGNWQYVPEDAIKLKALVADIEKVREHIKQGIIELE